MEQSFTVICGLIVLSAFVHVTAIDAEDEDIHLAVRLPEDPSIAPANVTVSFRSIRREGNYTLSFWWCYAGDPWTFPDEDHKIACHPDSKCEFHLPHQYVAGNCTTRLQVFHDWRPTEKLGETSKHIFVKAHLTDLVLTAPAVVATNTSTQIAAGALPFPVLTGPLDFTFNLTHNETHRNKQGELNHTFHQPGAYNVSVLASNKVSNLTASQIIIVQDEVKDLNISKTLNHTKTDVTVTFACTLSQGTDVQYTWQFDDGQDWVTAASPTIRHKYRDTGLYNVTVIASNNVSQLNFTLAVQVTPNPLLPVRRDVEITVPICLTVLVVVLVATVVRYRRIIFNRRGVEAADYNFLNDSTDSRDEGNKWWWPWHRRPSSPSKHYGTVEMFDDL